MVKAFVVLTADFKKRDHKELIQELQMHVKSVTAPYKYPRKVTHFNVTNHRNKIHDVFYIQMFYFFSCQIEFVDHLPKTVSGKIRRVELRKKEWEEMTT